MNDCINCLTDGMLLLWPLPAVVARTFETENSDGLLLLLPLLAVLIVFFSLFTYLRIKKHAFVEFIEASLVLIASLFVVIYANYKRVYSLPWILIYVFFVLLFKISVFIIVKTRHKIQNWKPIQIKNILYALSYSILSFDYCATHIMKNMIPSEERVARSCYIKISNLCNLVFSMIYCLVIWIVLKNPIGLVILAYRILSRCIEIIVSFFKDVCSGHNKSSSLKYSTRVGLAVSSLHEVVILCATFYGVRNGNLSFFDAVFKSFATLFGNYDETTTKIVQILEIATGTALLGIVIAAYLDKQVCPEVYIIKKVNGSNKLVSIIDMKFCERRDCFIFSPDDSKNGVCKTPTEYQYIVKYKDNFFGRFYMNKYFGSIVGLHYDNFYIELNHHLVFKERKGGVEMEIKAD